MDRPLTVSPGPAQATHADGVRLLPSRRVLMPERVEEELVDALAELLLEWLELHPQRRPAARVPSGGSALVSGFSREEEA